MKIFISWSGEISKQVAYVLRDWLKDVFHPIEIFMSAEDIDKGTRWSHEISRQLETTSFGILCVTRDNIHSPWLNFEAGALSKSIQLELPGRVCPFLFGITAHEISSPLSQFQATTYDKEDIKRLVFSINKAYGDTARSEATLGNLFDKFWTDIHEKLEPVYQLTRKKIVWAFETLDLVAKAQTEINMTTAEGGVLAKQWNVADENPPNPDECDVLIYAYGKSENSTERLIKVMDFIKTLPPDTCLLVYTFYASDDGRLTKDEFDRLHTHGKSVMANMPETLNQQLKKII